MSCETCRLRSRVVVSISWILAVRVDGGTEKGGVGAIVSELRLAFLAVYVVVLWQDASNTKSTDLGRFRTVDGIGR